MVGKRRRHRDSHGNRKLYVIMSYLKLKVSKLYQSAMPSTAQVKNLFLIIQNLILLKINISVSLDFTSILHNDRRQIGFKCQWGRRQRTQGFTAHYVPSAFDGQ